MVVCELSHCCGFSSCGAQALGCKVFSSCNSLAIQCRLKCRLNSCAVDLPGPGIEAMSALTGRFFTTESPGKSLNCPFIRRCHQPFLPTEP